MNTAYDAGIECTGSTSDLLSCGDPAVGCSDHRDWSELSGDVYVQIIFFTNNFMVYLVRWGILVPFQGMGWSCVHAYLATADLSEKPWCMRPYAPSDVFIVDTFSHRCIHFHWCMVLYGQHLLTSLFHLSEEWMEGGSRLKHRSDVEVLTHRTGPPTNTSYIREGDSRWPHFLIVLSQGFGCRGRIDEKVLGSLNSTDRTWRKRSTISYKAFGRTVILTPSSVLPL